MDFFYVNGKDRAEIANPLFVMIDEETGDKYFRWRRREDWEVMVRWSGW